MYTKFDPIRPFNDDEVNEVLQKMCQEDLFKTILNATFPEKKFFPAHGLGNSGQIAAI